MDNEILEEETKKYEIGFLLPEENETTVRNLIEKWHFPVFKEGALTKVNLAYPIKKMRMAFFNFIQFLAKPAEIAEFQKDLKAEKTILRFILLKLPKGEEKKSAVELIPKSQPSSSKKETKKSFEPLLTNEALEKKIEEILQ